jgi:hypothetical protein
MAKCGPEIVQATGNFHHLIRKELFGIAKNIFDNPAPLDTRNDVFDQNANARDDRVLRFLGRRQLAAFGFFLGLIDRDARRLVALKPGVLEQTDVRWKYRLFEITYPFVVGTTGIGFTQVAYQTLFDVGDEIVFHRMSFFSRCTDPSARAERLDDGPGAPCHR